MKKSNWLLLTIILVITSAVLFFTFSFKTEVDSMGDDIIAINEVLPQYAIAVNTGDFDLWISLWADDGHSIEETKVYGDLGLTRCTYTLKMTPKAGGETIIAMPDGKALTLYERQSDGSWKIKYDIFNSNAPPK